MGADDVVEQGRDACARHAWRDAYDALGRADRVSPLAADDLDRLGMAAYLIGEEEAALASLERAHLSFLADGEVARSVRCAFWVGMMLVLGGRHAEGGGWLARAGHLLESDPHEVEGGFLLVPVALQALGGGDPDTAMDLCTRAETIGRRFDAPDLVALGRLGQAQALLAGGEVPTGVAALDEAMVAVTTDDVLPITAGIVYCALILACRSIFDLRRAQEWTRALGRWCDGQQGLQPYRGQCLVHRSEVMQLRGEWTAAMAEVEHAREHLAAHAPSDPVLGMAHYQQGELLRLRGRFADAEQAYRAAEEFGHASQPGMALLRLAQGRVEEAEAMARRVEGETRGDQVQRARVLAAFVEIVLAAGDVEAARPATRELSGLAAALDAPHLRALADTADGALRLADEEHAGAGAVLRRAWATWQQLEAPYEAARTRVLLSRVCAGLGDHDTARMELDAARRVFERLGAAPDLAAVAGLGGDGEPEVPGGLTPREVEVLRRVATGATNREVAEQLVISEKTVARHVSNILTKLGVTSRSAATSWAHRHRLV